jgi:hypothetical protein
MCGFLILSLHHSSYGFIDMNLFRPRVLAAGAWFPLLSAIPFAAATKYREWPWSKIAQNVYLFYGISYGLSAPVMWIFNTELPLCDVARH